MSQPSSSSRALLAVLVGVTAFAGACRNRTGGAAAPPGGQTPGGAPAEAPTVSPAADTPALPQASRLRAPAGFRVETVTSRLDGVRLMAFSPDGRLFATQPAAGRVVVVPVGQGKPTAWATGLTRPHGIAFHGGHLYVANTNSVVRWRYQAGSRRAPGAPQRLAGLPTGGGHWTRTAGFGPDGRMYVSVGSSCNLCIEDDPRRAAILQFPPEGGQGRVYASGLRNAVGFTWDAQGRMWGLDNGTDNLGDDFPPEELNLIRDGGFYGWPYAHGDCRPDTRFGKQRPDLVRKCIPPALKMTAHSSPLGIAFYTGSQFPSEYRGNAFMTLHGSWNRSTPSGYKVVRIRFPNGRPAGATDFITGFGRGWARPVGVVVGPDGSLFVSDDEGGSIFRVRYIGERSSQRSTMR